MNTMNVQKLTCPSCHQPLEEASQPGGIQGCRGCSASWAPQGALARRYGTEDDLRARFRRGAEPSGNHCPLCTNPLVIAPYSHLEPVVELECCPEDCGVLLDEARLEQLDEVNERIRELFGDGTFDRPAPRKKTGPASWLRRLWPF